LKYFGQLGVDPDAQDSAGDGWSNWQKYEMGVNPATYVTPPAPQGLAAQYNRTNGNVAVSWLPSSGPVTGYTLVGPNGTNYVSASITSFSDNVDLTDFEYLNDFGPSALATYQVQADYSGGNSAWSDAVSVQSDPTLTAISPPIAVFSYIVAGPGGSPYLVVPSVPSGTAAIRLTRIDLTAYYLNGAFDEDVQVETNFDLPIGSATNGVFQIPPQWNANSWDAYGNTAYAWWAQVLSSNGDISVADEIAVDGSTYFEESNEVEWLSAPFFDGRTQLVQNLDFLFRAATVSSPFQCIENGNYYNYYYPDVVTYTNPPGYEYSGFYQQGTVSEYGFSFYNGAQFDPYWPFENNYRYQNFVLTPSDECTNGQVMTGIGLNGWDPYNDYDPPGLYFNFPPTNQFYPSKVTDPAGLSQTEEPYLAVNPMQPDFGSEYTNNVWYDLTDLGVTYSVDWTSYILTFYAQNTANYFGLPLKSVDVADQQVDYNENPINGYNQVVNAGSSFGAYFAGTPYIYPQFSEPKYQTVEYDFWQNPTVASLPGGASFSVTHTNIPLLAGVGSPNFQVVAYEKREVTNSVYSGVYGFLGQYFTNAFVMGSDGLPTSNPTGVLSPYGNFFATEPGQALLLTMPDADSGEQGFCQVSCFSLQLDKNHDGVMDTTFSVPDTTSASSPFVFWANNNFDRFAEDADDETFYDDDVEPTGDYYTENAVVADCNFLDGGGHRVIPTVRDLQDFARLWICGLDTNILSNLPSNYTVSLNWGDVGSPNSGNPTIDLFSAYETNGGVAYLTNQLTGELQLLSPYIGRIGPGSNLVLNASSFANNWAGNYFIWCGVSNGLGSLNLTISDGSGNVVAKTTAYIQITDIKQLYERWTVGNVPGNLPLTNAIISTEGLAEGETGFSYSPSTSTNTPYILYVHGWNMSPYDKDRFAECAYKRLYWQGYQGRFGVYTWPTEYGFQGISSLATDPSEKDNYDRSEYAAWLSGAGLLNKLNDLNLEYPNHVYMLAHSMGNIVAGEALRLSGNNRVVNTYVASQAALSAHTYDTNVPNYSFSYSPWSLTAKTPNIYGNWFAGNFGNGAGSVVNFYNTNDFALQRSAWQLNQLLKPDQFVLLGGTHWDYSYEGYTNDPPPWNNFWKDVSFGISSVHFDIANVLTNRYEVMGMAAQSYTTAFGATPGVQNVSDNIYLGSIWPADTTHPSHPFDEHYYHSAEFRGDYWQQQGYWSELLGVDAFNLK
jgi:hypothetical protein